MSKKPKYTTVEIVAAMTGTAGIVTKLASRLNVHWHTAKSYTEKNEATRQAWEAEKEKALDMAESALLKAIASGEQWAVKFYLSTIGKTRGYSEKHEVQNTGAPTIVVDWGESEIKGYVTISPDDWDTPADS